MSNFIAGWSSVLHAVDESNVIIRTIVLESTRGFGNSEV